MFSMQDDDGGVGHKQTSDKFSGFVMPQQDKLISYVIGTGKGAISKVRAPPATSRR